MAILDEIKGYCEVEDTDQYDSQLLRLANMEIAYLINNKVPISRIDANTEGWDGLKPNDQDVVISYIGLSVLRKFDRTLFSDGSYTTQNWIDTQLVDLIYQLKCIYDIEVI